MGEVAMMKGWEMKERDFQTEFSKRNTTHGVFELKFTKGKSLSFKTLAEHQERALIAACGSDGLYHKLSDFPVFKESGMRFNRKKPFDCMFLTWQPAYIVIMFWEPRKKKNVYYIKIENWLAMRESATRKSLTEDMAKFYASIVEDYTKKIAS